jgi:chromatin structure-remodeling complex protein RSC7
LNPGTPTPAQVSDEEMADADESPRETPQQDDVQDDDIEQEEDAVEDEDEMPQIPSEPSTPPDARNFDPPRKKRLGRPPKNPRPGWETPSAKDDLDTPQRRKRGRPAGFGGRGRGRGLQVYDGPKMAKIDKEGTLAEVVNDEVELPEDAEGEEKVDKLGNLQGGRDYRVRVFTVKNRGKRLYMLSTEPARCCGFRDSYLFFAKHMKLYKVIVDDDEKQDLITREIIPHSYKGRSIGVCTARSVFREFGARIVIGGKRITDDYYAEQAREDGVVEGELADPNDVMPPEGKEYNKNQYVAWHGASQVYHTGMPTVPSAAGKPVPGKRKIQITSANWQLEHARAARYVHVCPHIQLSWLTFSSNYNSMVAASRKANLEGVYDPHTNMMHYPKIMQHTHVRWEQVTDEDNDAHMTNGISHLTNGVNGVHLNGTRHDETRRKTKFPPVDPIISRNFMVVDTIFESPPHSGLGIPGPDGDALDVGTNGISNISDDILDELPAECRRAFEEAKERELEWKGRWGSEHRDGARGDVKIGFLGFPV